MTRSGLWKALSADAVFAVDDEQRVVTWNGEASRLLGYGHLAAVGARCYQLVRATDETGHRFCRADCPVVTAAERGQPAPSLRLKARTRHGAYVQLDVSTIVISADDGSRSVIHLCRPANGEKPAIPDQLTPLHLTNRERQILSYLCNGDTTSRGIADEFGIRRTTARNEVQHLLEKLAVHSRAEAVALAYRQGLLL